jgi:hypothetical protein
MTATSSEKPQTPELSEFSYGAWGGPHEIGIPNFTPTSSSGQLVGIVMTIFTSFTSPAFKVRIVGTNDA